MQILSNTNLTKIPTAQNEERILIARALTRKEDAFKLVSSVDESVFFNEKNKRVFLAIKSLISRAQDPDITMVNNELKGDNLISLSELADYVANEVPNYALLESVIAIVQQTARERKVVELSLGAVQDISAHKSDVLPILISNLLSLQAARSEKTSYSNMDLSRSFAETMSQRSQQGGMAGVPFGYRYIDYMTKGAQPGQLIVIGGRPSNGKSAFCENVALNMMCHGARVLFFSLETPASGISDRMIGRLTGLGHEDIKRGFDDNDARTELITEKATLYSEFPWEVIDDPTVTSEQILSIATQYKLQNKVDIIFVDYLQLVRQSRQRGEGRNEIVGRICSNLKITARSLNVPVIVTAQLNRDAEDRDEPELHHLRESGNIEADADVAMLIYRGDPDKYPGVTFIKIAKNRDGQVGNIKLAFEGKTVSFTDIIEK